MQKISKNAQVIIHVHVHVPLSKQFIVQGLQHVYNVGHTALSMPLIHQHII